MASNSGIQVLLRNITLRLYVTRAILICALQVLSISVQWIKAFSDTEPRKRALWILLFILIFVHHLISFKRWRFFYNLLDILLIGVEIAGIWLYIKVFYPLKSIFPETLVIHAVLCWTIFVSLIILTLFRIASFSNRPKDYLWTPFDIHSDQPANSKRPKLFNLVMGRSIWKEQFRGESIRVRAIRGILGLIFLGAILFFILLNVIFKPMQETALSPVRQYRTLTGQGDLKQDLDLLVWNVVFPIPSGNFVDDTVFYSAVKVTPLWPSDVILESDDTLECDPQTVNLDLKTYSGSVYTFQCFALRNANWLPSIDISADFSLLPPVLNSLQNTTNNLPVMLGMTNDTKQVLLRSVPTTLLPGVNTIASVTTEIRQIYDHRALASLGLFQSTQSFFTAKILDSYPNPSASQNPNNPNLSTLRLFWADSMGEITLTEDYRQSSVMAGFSAVGGLWTTLSGIFTIVFGASMLRILYGSKPLSIFGAAHSFQSDNIKEMYLERYPNILTEKDKDGGGLLSLLRDHLIDLKFLDEKHDPKEISEKPLKKEPKPDIESTTDAVGDDDSRKHPIFYESSQPVVETRIAPLRRNDSSTL